jgi:pimeloyl-ACP methyl ester carboxylesterase
MAEAGDIDFEVHGAGFPIFVLHGGNVDRHSMIDALEPAFVDGDAWRRIYLDTPGHGGSSAEGIKSNNDVLLRLTDFINAKLGAQRFALIGESRGGYYARVLAHMFAEKVDGLMMIVPAHAEFAPDPEELPEHVTLVPAPELRDTVAPLLHSRFDRLVVQNEEIIERMTRTELPALKRLDEAHQQMIANTFKLDGDPDEDGGVFASPALCVMGRQDTVGGYKHMLRLMESYPRGTFAVLDCSGHSLSWERPDLFLALTRDWLQRMEYT